MTPTQGLKHALDLEQERSRTLEAVVKALQVELKAEKVKAAALVDENARLKADIGALQDLAEIGKLLDEHLWRKEAAALADRYEALRLAAEAYLDARDAVDPIGEAGARRRLDAVLGRAPRSTSEGGGLGGGPLMVVKVKPLGSGTRSGGG